MDKKRIAARSLEPRVYTLKNALKFDTPPEEDCPEKLLNLVRIKMVNEAFRLNKFYDRAD